TRSKRDWSSDVCSSDLSGCSRIPSRRSWLGGESHPSGNARPNTKRRLGINSAATTPPALKTSHNNGSIDRLGILLTEQEPRHDRRRQHPCNVIGRGNPDPRHPPAC